ncbi:hypothetical protein HMPREF9413_4712 [Paenibacillus sp. HGF7]|nr:hypothetical protein [Paenibacillus sp. GbtcB18]EGL19480.1 hypothetical protein HMPREF9413_4712 [Paenibacillus sp. HGF7]
MKKAYIAPTVLKHQQIVFETKPSKPHPCDNGGHTGSPTCK